MFLVSGGYDGPNLLDSTEIFDPSLRSWRAKAALPSPREGLKATNIDNRVLLFGNENFTDIKYIGDDNSVILIYLQVVMMVMHLMKVIISTPSLSMTMTSLANPTHR